MGTNPFNPLNTNVWFDETNVWFDEQLGRYTYKPGWRFYVHHHHNPFGIFNGPYLIGIMTTEDTYHPGRTIEVSATYPIQFLDRDEENFAHCLQALIQKMEIHESQEWLRRDGQIYNDPHKQRS